MALGFGRRHGGRIRGDRKGLGRRLTSTSGEPHNAPREACLAISSDGMPIQTLSAADAFDTMKKNPYAEWPRADDPDNRFAAYADPEFNCGFMLQPGQKIFTIGSCFARNIVQALAERGFEIPMQEFTIDKLEWGGDPLAIMNTY